MLALLALATSMTAASKTVSDADQRLARMAALYDEVCLKAFPDDDAVTAIMSRRKARELTPAEVKVTMVNDPARGWALDDDVGNASVWIEFPPYHACSVRWNSPEIGNLDPYRAIAERYKSTAPGFHPTEPMEADQGAIHIRLVSEVRTLKDDSRESLMFVDQHIRDPKLRASGATGVVLRFVHQFAPRPSAEEQ